MILHHLLLLTGAYSTISRQTTWSWPQEIPYHFNIFVTRYMSVFRLWVVQNKMLLIPQACLWCFDTYNPFLTLLRLIENAAIFSKNMVHTYRTHTDTTHHTYIHTYTHKHTDEYARRHTQTHRQTSRVLSRQPPWVTSISPVHQLVQHQQQAEQQVFDLGAVRCVSVQLSLESSAALSAGSVLLKSA